MSQKMEINYKITWESLKNRVLALKAKDKDFKVFGSNHHQYQAGNCLTEAEILAFEEQYKIRLPEDYRAYLQYFGNGGVGKDYGIIPLQRTVFPNAKPHLPFCLTMPYFPEYDEYGHFYCNPTTYETTYFYESRADFIQKIYGSEEIYQTVVGDYYSKEEWTEEENAHYESIIHYTGTLCIADEGCGHLCLLVVSGAEYGNIWGDSMVSDYGIYPHTSVEGRYDTGYKTRVNFLRWYEQWVEKAEGQLT